MRSAVHLFDELGRLGRAGLAPARRERTAPRAGRWPMIALLLLTAPPPRTRRRRRPRSSAARPSGRRSRASATSRPGRPPPAWSHEAITLVGSPDPEWRDDIGYGVVAACVQKKQRLSAAERRSLVEPLLPEPAQGDRRDGQRLGAAAVLLGAHAFDRRGGRAARAGARRARLQAPARRRARVPARRARPARLRAARRLDPRDRAHGRPPEVPSPRLPLHVRRPGTAARSGLDRMAASSAPVFTHAEDERLAAALVSRRAPRRLRCLEPRRLAPALRDAREAGVGEVAARHRRPSTRPRTRATCCGASTCCCRCRSRLRPLARRPRATSC